MKRAAVVCWGACVVVAEVAASAVLVGLLVWGAQ